MIQYDEPRGGDFVAYVDRLVGKVPEDPESAAREITARLAARARENLRLAGDAAARAGSTAADTREPDVAGSDPDRPGSDQPRRRAVARPSPPDLVELGRSLGLSASALFSRIGSLVIAFGALLTVAGILSGFSAAPGLVLIAIGWIVKRVSAPGFEARKR